MMNAMFIKAWLIEFVCCRRKTMCVLVVIIDSPYLLRLQTGGSACVCMAEKARARVEVNDDALQFRNSNGWKPAYREGGSFGRWPLGSGQACTAQASSNVFLDRAKTTEPPNPFVSCHS